MSNSTASMMIEGEWLPTYEKMRNLIWQQLIELNCSIYIVERIEVFPFDLFLPMPDDRLFWQLTKNALIERSLLTLSRISADESSSGTIQHFRGQVIQHIRDDSVKKGLKKTLKEVKFDSKIRTTKEKVSKLRNKLLAHLDIVTLINPTETKNMIPVISHGEITELLANIQKLFDILCFDHHHSLWYMGYEENTRKNQQTDIDRLLDFIAQRSPLLNMPEEQPEVWPLQKSQYSEQEITTLNMYRRKFGLKDV